MIKYHQAQKPRIDQLGNSPVRTRVLSVVQQNMLLYSVSSSTRTEFQLVSENGETATVIAFNKYMDIVDADLSSDFEIIVYTERIISKGTFKYVSVLCHIHSFSKLKVFEDNLPIASYFLPDNSYYQLLHIIGHKLMHFKLFKTGFNKFEIKVYREGLNITNCKKWFYSSQKEVFYAFSNNYLIAYKARQLNDGSEKSEKLKKYFYDNDNNSYLPEELALIPSTFSNHPYYRFSSGNVCVTRMANDDYGIVEQLYCGDDSCLTFMVSTVVSKFRKIVSVPRAQPDLPISFITHKTVVFAFVPNCFIALIDFSLKFPHITMMPRSFCDSIASPLTLNIGSSNYVVDLDNGEVYKCNVLLDNFPESLNYTDRTILSIFARLTTVLPNHIAIPQAIKSLPYDINCIQFFFKSIFTYANQIFPVSEINVSKNLKRRKTAFPQKSLSIGLLSMIKKSDQSKSHEEEDFQNLYMKNQITVNSNKLLSKLEKSSNSLSAHNINFNALLDDKFLKGVQSNHCIKLSEIALHTNISSSSHRLNPETIEYQKQNEASFKNKEILIEKIKDSIHDWESLSKISKPEDSSDGEVNELSEMKKFAVEIIASYESQNAHMPISPINIELCSEHARKICPATIRNQLMLNQLISTNAVNENEKSSINYWRERFGQTDNEKKPKMKVFYLQKNCHNGTFNQKPKIYDSRRIALRSI